MSETNNKSLGFSSFRTLLDLWDNYVLEENVANEIEKILNGKKILFFFKFKDKGESKLYGTDDNNRIVYATWKNPTKSDISSPVESFQAYDLKALFNSKNSEEGEKIRLFNKKDLPKISTITDRDEIVADLAKHMTGKDFSMPSKTVSKSMQIIKDKKNERK